MSELKTRPVFRCKRCGRPVVVAHLSTSVPDEEGELLRKLLEGAGNNAYCNKCQARRNWYATQGRLDDWEAGRP